MKTKYIEWDKEKLEEFLKDKFTKRTLSINELLALSKFLRKYNPTVSIDIGSFLGISGYIIGTSSESLEHLYCIEHTESQGYMGPYKRLVKTADYGKYLPDYAVWLTHGFELELDGVLLKHLKDKKKFVFIDSGKNTTKILIQLSKCFRLGVKYVAIHDTITPTVREAIEQSVKSGWYKVVEDYTKENGLTILKRRVLTKSKGFLFVKQGEHTILI